MSRVRIARLLREIPAREGMRPYDLNNGRCEDVAEEVNGAVPDAEALYTEDFFGEDTDLPGHVWIQYKGRHYDVEAPDGVEDPRDLPIFKNC